MKLSWRRRSSRDRDLDDEIAAHLALAQADRMDRGEGATEAAINARRELGNEALIKEVTRAMWGFANVQRVVSDSKYAVRVLRRNPVFTLTAILCLGIGVGAVTATFGIADALLLRPLPVREPSRVVVVTAKSADNSSEGLSWLDFNEVSSKSSSFEGMIGFQLAAHTVTTTPEALARRRMGLYVVGDFFGVLGVQPSLGRGFRPEETGAPGRDPVIVLSHGFWQSEFGGDPAAVGRTVRVNGQPFTIIGVAPRDFAVHLNLSPAYYIPFTMSGRLSNKTAADPFTDRSVRGIATRGRLRDGVSQEQAGSEIQALGQSLAREFPSTHKRLQFVVRSEVQERIEQAPPLAAVSAMLIALSAGVLIIACANITSLLLARAQARNVEMSVRLSIGAGRARLLQQLLTESLVLSVAAAGFGVLLAAGAVRYLGSIQIPTDTPLVMNVQMDSRVLLAALAAAILTAVLAGFAPAWKTVNPVVKPVMWKTPGRNSLVVSQVALSVILLVVSGGMIDAFRRMLLQDPGIRTDRVMMVELDPSLVQYSPEQTRQFFREVLEKARNIPGARSAALSRAIPFRPNFTEEKLVPEGVQLPPGQEWIQVSSNVVDPGYFRTMGVKVTQGRPFTAVDTAETKPVAIVNDELARRFWPGQNAVGRRFRMGTGGPYVEIVGVTRTGKYLSLTETPQPYFYLPLEQQLRTRMTLLVEADGDAASLARPVLEAVRSIDPNQPVYNVRDMRTYYRHGVLGLALTAMRVIWTMAGAGLLLACIGLYGLISYSVARRTREIGIRMAIGADQSSVLRVFVRQGMMLSAVGAAAGLVVSIPVFKALAAALAGLGQLTLWTLVAAPLALLLVALLACYLPARMATRVNPTYALRVE